MYAAGRTKDAGESLLKLVNTFDGPITEWISGAFAFTCLFACIQASPSDFTHRCLSALESDRSGAASTTVRHDNAPILHRVSLNSPTFTPLLRAWAKATLAGHSWKDSLVAAASASIFFCPCIPRGGLTLLVCSSWFRELRSIKLYVNISKQST